MEENPDLPFAVSSNLYDQLTKRMPELSDQLIDIHISNAELTTEVEKGLGTLAGNMGIDVPDSLGEALPFVAEVILGIKLIHSIVSTERSLKGEELTDRSRVHGIRTLALMSKFGVTSVCFLAGATAGGGHDGGFPGPVSGRGVRQVAGAGAQCC